jgi:hypothetical protein
VKRTIITKKAHVSHTGQVNFTTTEELLQCDPVMAGMFTINSYPAYVLFDSGASHSFMSQSFIEKHDISLLAMPFAFKISTVGGLLCVNTRTDTVKLELATHI